MKTNKSLYSEINETNISKTNFKVVEEDQINDNIITSAVKNLKKKAKANVKINEK